MKLSNLIAFVLIGLYLIMAMLKLHYPGLQADEVLFVKAAMGRYQGAIQYIKGVPIHLIAYIGALKSWIYYPIFKIFGISTESIRMPMILLTALSLMLLFYYTKKAFDVISALFVLCVMSLDTSLLTLTRMDIGPSAIEFFLKNSVLFCFIGFIRSKDVRWWLPIPVFIFAGIFNKLNFIWFFNSFTASALLIYWKDLWNYLQTESLRKRFLFLSSSIVGFGLMAGYLVFMIIHYKIFGVKNDVHFFASEFERVFFLFRTIITGEQVQFIYGDKLSLLAQTVFWVEFIGILLGLVSYKKQNTDLFSFFLFFFLNLCFTLIQHYFTKESYNPWHAFTVQPFFAICSVVGWRMFLRSYFPLMQKVVLFCFVSALFWVRGELFWHFYQHHGKPSNPYTQPATDIIFSGNAFYDLIDYAKSNDKKMVLLGWAVQRQLGIFTKQPERFTAAEELFHSPPVFVRKDSLFFGRYLRKPENVLFVAEGDPNKKYDLGLKLNPVFFEVLKKYHLTPVVVKDIRDGNDLIFRIYSVKPTYKK